MVEWSNVFDESHPVAGASAAEIREFCNTVAQPLTASEIEAIRRGQSNPFPQSDPMHMTWKPIDPSTWVLPQLPLPRSYLQLLSWSNGGEFRKGENWFQFFPALNDIHGVRAMLLGYHIPQYMPGALPIAFDGAGTFYVFDMRKVADRGEYPIYTAHSGTLSWDEDDIVKMADSLLDACLAVRHDDE